MSNYTIQMGMHNVIKTTATKLSLELYKMIFIYIHYNNY